MQVALRVGHLLLANSARLLAVGKHVSRIGEALSTGRPVHTTEVLVPTTCNDNHDVTSFMT